jgi:hypothetical protein
MILIIGFLILIGIGNLLGAYQAFTRGNLSAMLSAGGGALLYFIPAYGLLKLKAWARKLELVLSILFMLLGAAVLLFESMIGGVIILLSHGLIVAYLLSSECKAMFTHRSFHDQSFKNSAQ